ncbi:MAG TPA: succinate dehydrogenase/fumarate reductase iron-sulfur subunit [Chloroflexota bacterium]|nr:succinate dehydrogenase/fumarate reductase iron-sulfur subunit [Chloroflexota bacterium]
MSEVPQPSESGATDPSPIKPAGEPVHQTRFKVFRGDADGGEMTDYTVPAGPGMVVLDAMHWIQANIAGDLAVRWNCKAAKCGSCSAEINGVPRLMCKTRIDALGENDIWVQPMKTFPLIKDLVTDVQWNYEVNKQIPAFTPPADLPSPWRIPQEDVDRLYEFRKCIECFLCQDVCHVLRDKNDMSRYYGPRFMVREAYLDMHPMDTLDRRADIKGPAGVGLCNITKCCTEVCPEHIHITDNAIIPLKERVVDEYFDPILWAGRKLTGGRGRRKQPKQD